MHMQIEIMSILLLGKKFKNIHASHLKFHTVIVILNFQWTELVHDDGLNERLYSVLKIASGSQYIVFDMLVL